MHPSSTIDRPVAPLTPSTRSWSRAFADIRDGFNNRELWAHLGWQDIKQRYRRSVIGPLWITISMGVTAVGLGLLYSLIMGADIKANLPYVVVGFVVWGFISGCLIEGMTVFIANEGLIKHLPAPLTVYALRTVWRQTLMFAHNLVIYVIVLAIFIGTLANQYTISGLACGAPKAGICHPGLGWSVLLAIPAFLLIALSGGWATLLLGIISTRYRDIPQVINAVIQLLFYGTPIVWSADVLLADPSRDWAKVIFQLNPIYHYVEILRAPLLGQQINPLSWIVVGAITVVGWALALVAMKNYRARVSYWV